jgi:Pectate lyase superfamily protein
MTISTTTSRISYNGNSVTTVFSFPYKFLANGHLVVVEVSSTGVETTKTLTTHYTVTGAGDDGGGSVTMVTAPAVGVTLIIYRDTPITQETDYISGDPFPAETHESALDKLTAIAQEIGSDADRAIKVPVGDSSSLSTVLPAALDRLDKFIVFDATTGGTELSTVTQTQVASAVAAAYAAGSTADAVTFLQAGTGAVSRSVQAKLRDVVSLDDFGATGDGVTDDAAAIMAAHDSLPSTGGMIVAPRGIYRHASALTFSKRIKLVGEGTHYVNGSASATEFLKDFNGEGVVITGFGSTIEGCGFRGAGGNTGDGIVIKCGRVSLIDVSVFAMGQDGIRVGTDAGGENCNLWYMERIKSKNNGRDGIRLSEGAGVPIDASGGTMVHTDLQSNTVCGLNVQSSRLSTFVGVTSQSSGDYAVRLGAECQNNVFLGGDWEASGTADLRLDAGTQNNYICNFTLAYSQVSDSSTAGMNRIEMGETNYLMGGLKFPPTQIPSTNVNTLDDYEEGDFSSTVSVEGLSSAGTPTWTTRIATYTKVGNIVHVNLVLTWSAHTGTGNMRITGLPFTSHATLGRMVVPIASDSFTYGAGIPVALLQSSTTYLDLFLQTSGAAGTAIAMDTAATLYLNFSYRV